MEEINVKPFSINLLKDLIYNKILRIGNAYNYKNEFIPSLENLENYTNGLDYNSYNLHLKKQIDKLKEEIEKAKNTIKEAH